MKNSRRSYSYNPEADRPAVIILLVIFLLKGMVLFNYAYGQQYNDFAADPNNRVTASTGAVVAYTFIADGPADSPHVWTAADTRSKKVRGKRSKVRGKRSKVRGKVRRWNCRHKAKRSRNQCYRFKKF